MWALFQKEIAGFFSSLTGYIVIAIFLITIGLFLWVFPGNMNILDTGFSNITPLFTIAPWVFLFLVPAVTMRSFSEEKKSGTLDLLITRPLSELQIILGKYVAALFLILMALLPTIIYYISVIVLGSPKGNIDHGAYWGSFIGLLLLASVYASIGIFSSVLSENIIVSFLIAVFTCFVVYSGFDYIANLFPMGRLGSILQSLGIDAHYRSISRGVIDSRDLIYFLSAIALFIFSTRLILKSQRW